MCDEIILDDERLEIAFIRDAREIFTEFILHPSYKQLGEDKDCLCCLDIPACAEANGYDWRIDDDFGTYHLTKKAELPHG